MSDPTHTSFVAPDIQELAPLFPGYDIETLIATGGMGAVYRAVQRSLDRTVAIKILPREFSSDAAFCAGFEAEAKAMAKLNHPNLIGVFDFGEVNGMLFIIMEYVPGKSLYHSSHHQAIAPSEVIRIISAVCHGLAHAHEHGILHRDIKPSNILLDQNAEPKIGDFGLARPVDRQVQEGEEIFGTPHYTAPEVLKPPYTVDHRADIFSVGVMLHELLTGKLPADDTRPASAICRCDTRFDAIVRRATHPSPQLRYSSASEIAAELAVISGKSRTTRPMASASPRPGQAPPVPRRVPRPVVQSSSSGNGVVVTFLILAAIAGGAYFFLSNRPEPTTQTAPQTNTQPKPKPTPAPTPAPAETEPLVPEITAKSHTPAEPNPADNQFSAAEETHTQPVVPTPREQPDQPIFDVDGFLEKAVRIMREKTKDVMSSHSKKVADEFEDFGKALKRKARRVDYGKDLAVQRVESAIDAMKENGNEVPAVVPPSLSYIPDIREVFVNYHEKIDTLETTLASNLKSHANTYILGIDLQIKRLNASEDPVAVKLLNEEIDRTKSEQAYFANLMRGDVEPGKPDSKKQPDSKTFTPNPPGW